jgi:hypothetical protein
MKTPTLTVMLIQGELHRRGSGAARRRAGCRLGGIEGSRLGGLVAPGWVRMGCPDAVNGRTAGVGAPFSA